MKSKGRLIVIDGSDGSGKGTQTDLLVKHLKRNLIPVKMVDFPQYYSSFFGKQIGEYLTGKFGDAVQVNPFLASLLYAGDRYEVSHQMKQWLKEGKTIVANRYVFSNSAFQGAKLEGKKRQEFLSWVNELEYKVYGIPRENMFIFLDVPIKISHKLILKKNHREYTKGKKRDMLESDNIYQEKVYKLYLELVKKHKNGFRIDCLSKGELLSPDQIHDKIWKIVSRLL